MRSMDVSGARVICGGSAPFARTGCRYLARRLGHGFVRPDSFVRYMGLLTINWLKQSRLGRPRNKGWSTPGTHASMRTGCGCLGNSGRQTCDSCATFGGLMVMMMTIFLWIYVVRLYTHGKIGCIHGTLSYVDTYSCSVYPLDSGLYLRNVWARTYCTLAVGLGLGTSCLVHTQITQI